MGVHKIHLYVYLYIWMVYVICVFVYLNGLCLRNCVTKVDVSETKAENEHENLKKNCGNLISLLPAFRMYELWHHLHSAADTFTNQIVNCLKSEVVRMRSA